MKNSLSRAALALTLACTMVLVACTVDQVLSDIDIGLQIAANLAPAVGALNPADAAIITALTTVATDGINAIQKAYDEYEATHAQTALAKIVAAVDTVNLNLSTDLATFHITNKETVDKVNAWCKLIYSITNAVASALPAMDQTLPDTVRRQKAALLPTPEDLQASWAAQVCLNDTSCAGLVKVHHVHARGHGFWGRIEAL